MPLISCNFAYKFAHSLHSEWIDLTRMTCLQVQDRGTILLNIVPLRRRLIFRLFTWPDWKRQLFKHSFSHFLCYFTLEVVYLWNSLRSACYSVLEEVSEDFASQMFATSFFMVHDSSTRCENDISRNWVVFEYRVTRRISLFSHPNWRDGRRVLVHFSMSKMGTSNRGLMIPALFNLPVRLTTTLPALWSSTTSNSPMYPCFIMTVKNLMTTLELGRIRTWRFPRFSALLMHFKASARTLTRTMAKKEANSWG